MTTVHSMYWNNISPAIQQAQAEVFQFLGIPLHQHLADKVPHGEWMNSLIENLPEDEIVVIADIDAFPLTRTAYDRMVSFANTGGIFGLAQTANHLPTKDTIYAGPMLMAFRKSTWKSLGKPTMARGKSWDAGQMLSEVARSRGVPVSTPLPTCCLDPRWPLADKGVFGIGTFYGSNEYFHLFESRRKEHEDILLSLRTDVVNGRPLDFQKYLSLARHAGEQCSGENRRSSRLKNMLGKLNKSLRSTARCR